MAAISRANKRLKLNPVVLAVTGSMASFLLMRLLGAFNLNRPKGEGALAPFHHRCGHFLFAAQRVFALSFAQYSRQG